MKRKYKVGDIVIFKDKAHHPDLNGAIVKITDIVEDYPNYVFYDILSGPNTKRKEWSTENDDNTFDRETRPYTKLDKILI